MKKIGVLVVDDDPLLRKLVTDQLSRSGFDASSAASGEEALASLQATDYDVVLLDIRMDGMTGLDTLREIRKTDDAPEVVMLTADTSLGTGLEAMRLGAYDYLTKPSTLDEMEAVIRKADEKRRLVRQNASLRAARASVRGSRAVESDGGTPTMQATTPQPAQTRLTLHRLAGGDGGGAPDAFAEDVRRGLTSTPKRLSPKYFYDGLGSTLFEAICKLPEYYLTRAEDEILARDADEIVSLARAGDDGGFLYHDETYRDLLKPEPVTLVEFGSGSSTKTRRVIEALLRRQKDLLYVPIDISHTALEASAHALLDEYPQLRVEAYAGDYDAALARLGEGREGRGRTLALFLGSNVGNFDTHEAQGFLRRVRGVLSVGDALLVGADLKKDAKILEAAYDDPLGVTAAFNLNLLARINRELGADFDPRAFRHVARYDADAGRVEMYVESARDQTVRVPVLDLAVHFAAGERVHTENSHKYDAAELSALARGAGFFVVRTWRDAAGLFSSNFFTAVREREPTR